MCRSKFIELAHPGSSAAIIPLLARCPLVLACDEGYAMPLATTLRSVAESNQCHWPLDVNVLNDGFSNDAKEKVIQSLPDGSMHIRWIPVDLSLFEQFGLLDHVSRMTFARLQIPRIFAETASKILYLDTDILVLGDLSPLFQTDLGDASVGAVLDFHVDSNLKSVRPERTVGVPRVRNYFNAGVLLIDVGTCRQRMVAEKALDYLRGHADSPYADQDALNVACDGDWKQLDTTWNFQNHHTKRIRREPASKRPAIVHFITSSKPWKPSSASVNAAFYDDFRSRTRFSRSPTGRVWAALSNLIWRVKYRLDRMNAWLAQPGPRPHESAQGQD